MVWKGSSDCGDEARKTFSTFLPAGGESVCIKTRVWDGGQFVHVSGMLRCDID